MTAQGTCYLFLQLAEKSCCKTHLKHQFYCHRKTAMCVGCIWQHYCAVVKGLSDLLLTRFYFENLATMRYKISPDEVCIQDFPLRKGVSQRGFFFFNVKKIKILD